MLGLLALTAGLGSCFTGSDGLVPPTQSLYFPTGIVVSPGRTTLYVANSDFDLQYNGGTVQALNLADAEDQPGLRTLANRVIQSIEDGNTPAEVCDTIGSTPNLNTVLYPGPCTAVDAAPFVRAYATIGAFAGGISLLSRDDGEPGARLFVSVRGDPSVTYFDIADDRDGAVDSPCESSFCLECIGEGDEKRCDRSHRIGENIFTSQRGLLMPTEPTSVASAPGRAGDPLVVAHQTAATASLLVNTWPAGSDTTPFAATPSLEFLLEDLPEGPTIVASIPAPAYARANTELEYRPGFAVTHRAATTLTILRYFDDEGATPPRPFLVKSDDVSLTLSNDNSDSRGLAFDTTARDRCEQELCLGDLSNVDCMRQCLEEDVDVYIASRSPASLLVGKLHVEVNEDEDGNVTSLDEVISMDETVPVPLGPALVSVGKVIGVTGELETRIFVVCFDSRFVVVYDPTLRRVETTIRTGRGPFSVAFDTGTDADGNLESLLYITHFTDSYLSVADLDSRRISYATPILNIGPPVVPREEQ